MKLKAHLFGLRSRALIPFACRILPTSLAMFALAGCESEGMSGEVSSPVEERADVHSNVEVVQSDFKARRDEMIAYAFKARGGVVSEETVAPPQVEDRFNVYGGYAGMALRMGLHVEAANQVLRRVAEWFDHPHVRGRDHRGEVDFTALELARVYVDLKDSLDLEKETRERIRRFFLTEDFASKYYSENHVLVFRVARYLMACELPDAVFEAYGMTGAELQELDAADLKTFIRYRAQAGWGEFDSAGYQALVMKALLTLYDFAPDPELADLSEAMLNLLLADMAVDTVRGLYAGARGRVPETEVLEQGGAILNEMQYLYLGIGDYEPDSGLKRLVGKEGLSRWEASNEAFFSDFRPMDIVVAIALNRSFPYQNKERKHLHVMSDVIPERPVEGSIRKFSLLTDDYHLGAIQLQDPYPRSVQPGDFGYAKHQQLDWIFGVTADPRAVIFTHHPGKGGTHTYWRGADHRSDYVQTFQNDTAVLARWDIRPDATHKFIHAYLPVSAFDEVQEADGWIFARKGDVYAALYLHGGYEWVKDGQYALKEVISRGQKKASVFESGHADDFGSFASFREEILSNSVAFDPKTMDLSYASQRAGLVEIRGDGRRFVNGQAVDLDYPTYSSPYLNSEWKSGVVTFSIDGMTRQIDFNQVPFRLDQ